VPSQPVRVAIDLETTGLLSEQDSIIEVGAIKFAGAEVLDTFESFVAPRTPLPYRVQRLTGLRRSDLAGAPSFGELADSLRTFLGDYPLVGHSVPFDAAFLRRVGLAKRNPLVDTYELASALLPDLPSYTLEAVGAALGVASPTHHRALADARLACDVFLALLQRLDALDPSVVRTLGRLTVAGDWTPAYFVRAALRAQHDRDVGRGTGRPERGLTGTLGDQLAAKLGLDPLVLGLAVAQEPVHGVAATAPPPPAVEGDPPMARTPPSLPEVTAAVAACVEHNGTALIEVEPRAAAIVACLEPFVRRAASGDERVLVVAADAASAARVAHSRVPEALARLGLPAESVSVALLGAHDSYLCLHRWFGAATLPRDGVLPRELARGLAKVAVWSHATRTGGRDELALTGQESAAWERARAGREFSHSVAGCAYRSRGYCFVGRAEEAAQMARVVVTTHAALADHLAGLDHLLPQTKHVLVLDTHQLEDELRRAASWSLECRSLVGTLANLAMTERNGARAGLFHIVAQQGGDVPEAAWFAQVARAQTAVETFFVALSRLQSEAQRHGKGSRDHGEAPEQAVHLDERTRRLPTWAEVEAAWAALEGRLRVVARLAQEVVERHSPSGGKRQAVAADGVATDLLAARQTLEELCARVTAVLGGGQSDNVCWLRAPQPPPGRPGVAGAAGDRTSMGTVTGGEPPTLHVARVEVSGMLGPLVAPGHTLVLAGSALAVAGEFDYSCGALGLSGDEIHTISSVSDCTEQTLLLVAEDAAEPNVTAYQRQLDEALVALGSALGGRLVAIFPSHAAVRAAYAGIRERLEQQDVLVLAQGIDGSARQLWQTFRSQPRVVVLGAGAFWDGAEQSGTPPACVVITRLPFPSLSDPLLAARAEQWPDPQSQFVVPYAALKVRQALNGLAWSRSERNAVVLFDHRVVSRGYGATLLATLPRCTVRHEPRAQLADQVVSWLDGVPAQSGH
jgi:ATP-dependent DNA helicase DinG